MLNEQKQALTISTQLDTGPPEDASVSTPVELKKPRPRLRKAGLAVLQDYLSRNPVDLEPTPATQKQLLQEVQAAQPNDGIKITMIERWFKRQQKQRLQIQTMINTTPMAAPLSNETLRKLHTLVQATPNPNDEVLDIWASLFSVSRSVLQYILQVILPVEFPDAYPPPISHADDSFRTDPFRNRLPTPSESSTPEPVLRRELHVQRPPMNPGRDISRLAVQGPPTPSSTAAYSSASVQHSQPFPQPTVRFPQPPHNQHYPHTPTSSSIPTVPPFTKPHRPPLPHKSTSLSSKLSPPLTPIDHAANPVFTSLQDAILHSISQNCLDYASQSHKQPARSSQTRDDSPKTAAAFNERFQPYQNKINTLLQALPAPRQSA